MEVEGRTGRSIWISNTSYKETPPTTTGFMKGGLKYDGQMDGGEDGDRERLRERGGKRENEMTSE